MASYRELIEGGISPEEARKFLLTQRVSVVKTKQVYLPELAEPAEKPAEKESFDPNIPQHILANIIKERVKDEPDYIKELRAEFDGVEATVTKGIRRSEKKGMLSGYWMHFRSLEPPRVLQELPGHRYPEELKEWYNNLRTAYPYLIVTSRWIRGKTPSERDKWVFTGARRVPATIWRWAPETMAPEVLKLKPTKIELVSVKRILRPAAGVEVPAHVFFRRHPELRLTPVPEYYTPHE